MECDDTAGVEKRKCLDCRHTIKHVTTSTNRRDMISHYHYYDVKIFSFTCNNKQAARYGKIVCRSASQSIRAIDDEACDKYERRVSNQGQPAPIVRRPVQ